MAEKTPHTKNLAQLLVKIAIGNICGWWTLGLTTVIGRERKKPTVTLLTNAYYQRQHALVLESALSYVH